MMWPPDFDDSLLARLGWTRPPTIRADEQRGGGELLAVRHIAPEA
jgi:hypothetical protein